MNESIVNRIDSKIFILIVSIAITSKGCISGGTHGSLKAFDFPVAKSALQSKVEEVINENSKIVVSPITDSFTSKYYNDGKRYVTIEIANLNDSLSFIFQYSGDETYWDTSKISSISIAYAYDGHGNGGSAAHNNFKWYDTRVKSRMLRILEKELIAPVRKKLNLP